MFKDTLLFEVSLIFSETSWFKLIHKIIKIAAIVLIQPLYGAGRKESSGTGLPYTLPQARVIAQALPVFDIKFGFTFGFTYLLS